MNDLSEKAAAGMAKAMFCECEADFIGGWRECRALAEADKRDNEIRAGSCF